MSIRHERQTGDHDLRETNTLDAAFEALSHPQRRRVLSALVEASSRREAAFTYGELRDRDGAIDPYTTQLHHTHLPKLEAAGFVHWDRDRHEVLTGPAFERIRPLLELFYENPERLPGNWR
ncbi:DUF7344 domain-containing protein [Haloarchaeobius sp. HRN-SO-5]|uniref:DUF7344 domain-containing protein n=1 Tax=Haloarchaeobius sp. HRN-SO-5 TaxID=3446118 RepID=UPI003EBC2375